MFFNKYTQVECVHEEDYNDTQFYFELSEGLHLDIGIKFDNDWFEVVCLHPLKVIECR